MRISLRRAFLAVGIAALCTSPLLAAFPTARTASRMVYDDAAGRVVLFGGISGPDAANKRYEMNDTWEWNGSRWTQKYPAASPGKRSASSMVFFPPLGGTLLFGGTDASTSLVDTWLYRGGNWQQLNPASSPSKRSFGAIAFDTAGNRAILYGGSDVATSLFDTWQFDGSSWTMLRDNGPRLTDPLMVYDGARQEILLLGWNDTHKTEMYRWSSSDWQQITPTTLPECLRQGAVTFEASTGRVLYVGGGCAEGGSADDTWAWDGTDWAKLELTKEADGTTVTQSYSTGHALAYDKADGEAILYGGFETDVRNRTLLFRDNKWTVYKDRTSPGPMSLGVFENDPARGVSWLFGGHNEESSYFDLWKLSGSTWQFVDAANAPTGCFEPTGAFDTDRGRLVIVCEDSSTFEWDGDKWYSYPDLKDKPPAGRRFSSAVYDPAVKKTVLFGGYLNVVYSKETWEWDGSTWVRAAKSGDSPSNRSNAAMWYDGSQQKIFLFGGIGRPTGDDRITRYDDMWSFDGSKWTELTKLSTKPSPRYGMQVSYDEGRRTAVMFGGKDEQEQYLDDQWEWNGSSWTKAAPAAVPSSRMNGMMVYDAASQRLLLFGGYAGIYFSELWQNAGGGWDLVRESIGRRRPIVRSLPPSGAKPAAVTDQSSREEPQQPDSIR